jgi:hypothetical protein
MQVEEWMAWDKRYNLQLSDPYVRFAGWLIGMI